MGAVERLRELGAGREILGDPAPREKDGLRASPANATLSPEERAAAPALFRALLAGQLVFGLGEKKPAKILKAVRLALDMEPRLSIEAFEVVDAQTLRPVGKLSGAAILIVAAWAGKTLLADSIRFEPAD